VEYYSELRLGRLVVCSFFSGISDTESILIEKRGKRNSKVFLFNRDNAYLQVLNLDDVMQVYID
jgi:hypothetical protein